MSDLAESIRQEFLMIKALDDDASIRFSEHTRQWYVSADIEITDGELISGVTVHQFSPWEAVQGYLHKLQAVDGSATDTRIVTKTRGARKEWVWNGAAWKAVDHNE